MSLASRTPRRNSGSYENVDKSLIGEIGFVNLGNTCYINATLQILINSKNFEEFLYSIQESNLKEDANVFYALKSLFLSLKNGSYNASYLKTFRDTIQNQFPFFRGNREHDASEFLNALIDRLGEEIKPGEGMVHYRKLFIFTLNSTKNCLKCQKRKKHTIRSQDYLNIFLPIKNDTQSSACVPSSSNNFSNVFYIPYFFDNGTFSRPNFNEISKKSIDQYEKTKHLMLKVDNYGFPSDFVCSPDQDFTKFYPDCNFVLELPSRFIPNEPDSMTRNSNRNLSDYPVQVVIVNTEKIVNENSQYSYRRFSIPFTFTVNKSISYLDLISLAVENLIVLTNREIGHPSQNFFKFLFIGAFDKLQKWQLLNINSGNPLDYVFEHMQRDLGIRVVYLSLIWPLDSTYTKQLKNSLRNLPIKGIHNYMYADKVLPDNMIYLETMIERFFKDTGNQIKCEDCNSLFDQRTRVETLPKILIIMLMRFVPSENSENEITIRKDNSFVSYPINNLDLSSFIEIKNHERYLYNLVGVMNHESDSTSTGHYTSYCYDHQKKVWHFCNDDAIKEVNSSEVVSKYAYILMYSRNEEALLPASNKKKTFDIFQEKFYAKSKKVPERDEHLVFTPRISRVRELNYSKVSNIQPRSHSSVLSSWRG